MFTKKYEFKVGSDQVVDFVRLLGRFGMRFSMTDERCENAYRRDFTVTRVYYRKFSVYTTKRKMQKFYNAVNILANYQLH